MNIDSSGTCVCILCKNGTASNHARYMRKNELIFSHPDCTVGSGITPDRPHTRFTDSP